MIANVYKSGLKLFSCSQLPRSAGFRAIAVTKDGARHRIEIIKGEDGIHRIDGCVFSEIIGWTNYVGGEE